MAKNSDHGWSHDGLMHDLADHLRTNGARMVWCDMNMGPAGSQRPDVWTLNKSYSNPKPLAYEVKVSRADFQSDVTAGKWQGYLDYSCGVLFACPAKLIDKRELPKGCGLIVRSENVWRTVKGPTLNPVQIPEQVLLKCLIDGVRRQQQTVGPREASVWALAATERNGLSEDICDYLRDADGARRHLKRVERDIGARREELAAVDAELAAKRSEHRHKMDALKDEAVTRLCKRLGLDERSDFGALVDRVEDYFLAMQEHCSTDVRIKRLQEILGNVETALDRGAAGDRNPKFSQWDVINARTRATRREVRDGDRP